MSRKIKTILLALGDILLLYGGLFLASTSRKAGLAPLSFWEKNIIPFAATFLIWLFVFYSQRLYEASFLKKGLHYYENLIKAAFINLLLGFTFFYVLPYLPFFESSPAPKTILVLTTVNGTILIHIWRKLFTSFFLVKQRPQNIVIWGSNQQTIKLLKNLVQYHPSDFQITKTIQEPGELKKELKESKIETLVLDEQTRRKNLVKNFPQKLLNQVKLQSAAEFYEQKTQTVPIEIKSPAEMLEDLSRQSSKVYEVGKKFFDLALASLIGLVFLPLVPFIMLAIKIEDGGPIFYSQKRVGKREEIFHLLKFRTMSPDADANIKDKPFKNKISWAKEQANRVTKVGRFLRMTHLDEYPQILNILKQDMSFVGPRPERPQFVEKLKKETPYYNLRHLVKPGLTGWAQIHYVYGDSIETNLEKLKYDLYYVKNRSFLLDLAITSKTASIVLGTRGR